jgi:hypothetical protein
METPHFHIDHPHIAAEVYYLSAKEGGRNSPVYSGYRGQFHIRNSDWDAVQEFIDKEICQPGETANAYLKFATVHNIIPMAIGTPFQIREGATVVGRGIITVIIDKVISEASSIKTLYNEIDKITWNHWDPIGVNEYEEARDEYYSYLPKILRLLLSGAARNTIADSLFKIETKNMGLMGNYDNCLAVADRLIAVSN